MTTFQLLAVKIGNTNIGLGAYSGAQLDAVWRIEARPEKTADEYASEIIEFFDAAHREIATIGNVAICSVVPALTSTFEELCRRYLHCEPFVVEPGVRSGIRLRYEDPRTLGADRLAAMVGAKTRYRTPALVVDVGTATTFNALNAAGDFVGGAIAPGPNIQSDALHLFTAKLPRVEFAAPERALATNTRDALRSGLFFGYVGLVEGLIARLKDEMGARGANVIATGGLSPLVAPHCPSVDIVDTQLAFEGLRNLYEMNMTTPENQ